MASIKEVSYKCTNCGNVQVLRHSVSESSTNPYPCNSCKAGFGTPFTQTLREGMFPASEKLVA